MQPYRHIGACLTLVAVLFGTAAHADDATPPKGGVALELNAADLVGEACRITFVATNTGTAPIDRDQLRRQGRGHGAHHDRCDRQEEGTEGGWLAQQQK